MASIPLRLVPATVGLWLILAVSCSTQPLPPATESQPATRDRLPDAVLAPLDCAGFRPSRTEIAALRNTACPPQVDPGLWDSLVAGLTSWLADEEAGKTASIPPEGEANQLADIEFRDDGGGSYYLEWSYVNAGDYDQNSEVNVSDLTPLGVHFGLTSADSAWDTARVADGDRNGVINVTDITPIGQHYGVSVGGYNVYGSDQENGPWTLAHEVPFSASSGMPRRFSIHLDPEPFPFYLVVPFDNAGVEPGPARVVLGSSTPLVTESLPSSGGRLEGPDGSPLEGVSVNIPGGAMEESRAITLGYNDGEIKPVDGTFGGLILELSVEGPDQFYAPVIITVPYPGGDVLPVPYYIDAGANLLPVDLLGLDRENGTFSFSTFHASAFGWILLNSLTFSGRYDSGFVPSTDGFAMDNCGSAYNVEGECTGYTAFSQWYYRRHKSDGNLIGRFTQPVDASGRTGQDVIVTRAFASINLMWAYYWPIIFPQVLLDDREVYAMVRNVIANTRQPVMLHITRNPYVAVILNDSPKHSVMAYRCDNGKLWIYDPNYAGADDVKLTISGFPADFDYYGVYSWFYFVGNGTWYMNEPYSRILADATENFHGSHNAIITVTSHSDGQWVPDLAQSFRGTIASGDILVDQLELLLNGQSQTVAVPPSGEFQCSLNLSPGDNFIEFIPKGQLVEQGRVPVSHNITKRFKLVGDSAPLSGQLRFDVYVEPYYSKFSNLASDKPFLSYPSLTGTGWINYYVMGSLTEEPFAFWQDLTQYDDAGEATAGHIRLTTALPRAGAYEVGMSAPVNSHCSLRVTRITASGVASGSWEVQNGSPTVDKTWRGVVYNTATGKFELIDRF